MKSMKEYLTGISLCAALFIAGGCTNENEITGNSGGNGNGTPIPLTIRATAGNFGGLPETGKSDAPLTRTPTEDGSTTKFNTGDAIGIFAIKDGAIVDGISNTRLTYSDASGTDSWEPTPGTTLYYYEGISYIAYYPYKDGIGIDASQDTDAILASLAGNDGLQPVTNQSNTDGSAYTNSDLMTASGTPENGNTASEKILTLDFKHQFCLLVLVPRASVKCTAPADGGFVYRTEAKALVADNDVSEVILNGVTPFKMGDGSYRAIVKPTTNTSRLNGKYKTKGDRTINYEGNSYMAGFAAGYCYTLNVDSPLPITTSERPLAPGDFVFQNESEGRIEIYPGNGLLENGKIPDYGDAVGIVVTCDESRMTDNGCKDNGWNHAYVMGLENCGGNTGNTSWGPNVDEDVLANTVRSNGAENNMDGYTETEAMLAERTKKGDFSSYGCFNAINTYRISNPVPTRLNSVRSPWFVPSIGQWFDVMVNICGKSPITFGNNTVSNWSDETVGSEMWNAINSQLSKVDRPLTLFLVAGSSSRVFFACSSEMDAIPSWNAIWTENATNVSLGGIDKSFESTQRVVRPFFAF